MCSDISWDSVRPSTLFMHAEIAHYVAYTRDLLVYDLGDYHVFRVMVLDIRPATTAVPALLSYRGNNIVQYPGVMDKLKHGHSGAAHPRSTRLNRSVIGSVFALSEIWTPRS